MLDLIPKDAPANLLDFAESRVFQIAETRANKDEGPKAIDAILEETVEKIEQLYQKPHDGVTGYPVAIKI